MPKLAKVAGPTAKGVRPDFSGVAGTLCEIENLPLVFGVRTRTSPYDQLLRDLALATEAAAAANKPRPGLRFESPRARASLNVRSRKLGLKIAIAEYNGALYVRIEPPTEEDMRGGRKQRIIELLAAFGPMNHIKCAARLREKGDATIDASLAQALLDTLVRDGDLVLQEGGYFALNPRRKKVA